MTTKTISVKLTSVRGAQTVRYVSFNFFRFLPFLLASPLLKYFSSLKRLFFTDMWNCGEIENKISTSIQEQRRYLQEDAGLRSCQ